MATARPEAARPKRRRRAFATAGLQARQSAPKPGNGRLSRGDWIAAGQAVLCEVGIAGLRLSVLTRRLRVSTGSFYHHFTDMEDYLAALASHFSQADVRQILERATAGATERLSEDAALRAHLVLSANVALIGDFRLSGDCELFKGASSSYRAMRQPCQHRRDDGNHRAL